MGKLKNRWRAAIITWWLMLWWHWLEASAQNQDSIPEDGKGKIELVSNKTNGALAIDLSKKQNLDSLYNISWKIENLLSDMGCWRWNMNMYYWQDQYFEKLSELKKEYITEIKNSWLCNDVLKCWESEFDKRMEEINQEIMENPDNYWHFDSKWNFIINKENYEKLIKEKFPEFYESVWKDAFLNYWNEEYEVTFKKYEQKIVYEEPNALLWLEICIITLFVLSGFVAKNAWEAAEYKR